MKSLIVSHSDRRGGAARAAYRLHSALQKHGVESSMMVRDKQSDDWAVKKQTGKIIGSLRISLGQQLTHLQKTTNANLHSGSWLPSNWARALNRSTTDIVNLHWVAGETISIEDVGRIQKPVVWTLHDMWPFCGAEHHTTYDATARWRTGYLNSNRPRSDGGLDVNRLVWLRKGRAWRNSMHIAAPSRWLADCARQSALFGNWPVSVIPNVLDTEVFKPMNRIFSRQILGLPEERRIILFGAVGGSGNPMKGFDLLRKALERVATQTDPEHLMCVVFGESRPQHPPTFPLKTQWMGHLHDEESLALLYNAADVMVVPSRQENLPQTATEPQACGCPVVAFNCSGLPDAIAHQKTGYLAHTFDTYDLADGLLWVLEDKARRDMLGDAARRRALRLWAPEVVIPLYLKIYQKAIDSPIAN